MAPFLRDEGPPVSKETIQRARESLPLEFGHQIVNEKGREVLLVRVPKAKPDYLHDLGEVAFYVSLDQIRNTKDVLLIGHEKTARLEPQLLRDHVRAQAREDVGVVELLRRQLDKSYGSTIVQSPSNHAHQALAMRIPKESVLDFTPEDVRTLREGLQGARSRLESCQYAYIVANRDFERLGRRILVDLLGLNAEAQAAAPPLAPQAPPAPVPTLAAPMPGARPAFPATAGAAAPSLPTAFPHMAPPAPPPINSIARPQKEPAFVPQLPVAAPPAAPAPAPVFPQAAPAPAPAPVFPQAAPAPQAAAPSLASAPAAEVSVHDEYEIVSKPKPAATPAPKAAAAPLRLSASEDHEVQTHDEYEIVSKPKAPAAPKAPAPAAPSLAAAPGFDAHATDEYEVVTRKPAPAAAPPAPEPDPQAPGPAHAAAPERVVERMDAEFEVYTSKPKAPSAPPAPRGPAAPPPPAPTRTKEYEIMTRASAAPAAPAAPVAHGPMAPAHLPPASAVPAHLPTAAPAHAPAAHPAPPPMPRDDPRVLPTRTAFPVPTADSGAAIVPTMAPAAPELILAQRFRENGYEVVEGLRAQGTVFAFAAHRPNGRRVLVKRAGEFGPDDAASLAQLVSALGADVCLVVPDRVLPGTRLATWGTRLEVLPSGDVPGLAL